MRAIDTVEKADDESTAPRAVASLAGKRILIIVENLPVPFDRRVWQEARALRAAGAEITIICPVGKGYEAREEVLDGIRILRHPLPAEGDSALGYLKEYAAALWWESVLAWKIFLGRGFDAIHACNPPDLIFLVALPFKLLGKRFLFDHHDVNPELYETKFGKRDFFWRLMVLFERLTFMAANVSIATNESYKRVAIERGGMKPDDVFVVRSGPDLSRVKPVPPNPAWKKGRPYMVGYVGVMGPQEGIDLLLKAVAHLVHERGRTDIQFCLVGGGPSLASLKELSVELGVDDYVTFLGRAPDAELFEVLSTADVCVNPDLVTPMNDMSTMNKIMEYMAFSRPIVQFEVREGRYSAQEASLYARSNDSVDLADKLVELLDDPERRRSMGVFGRERVETQLSWNRQVEVLVRAYERLFGIEAPLMAGRAGGTAFREIRATPWLSGEPEGPAEGGVFIAWKPDCFRSLMTARSLGADLWLIAPFGGRQAWRKALRYVASFFMTLALLYARRPRYVLMLNQPLPLLVAGALYAIPFRVPFVLDGHSNAYVPNRSGLAARLFGYLTRRALFTANHNRRDAKAVTAMGGRSVLVPEIPGEMAVPTDASPLVLPRPSVLVVCSFANNDEPVEIVWEAALARPGATFYVTGDHRKADPTVMANVPGNVVLLGFVSREDFIRHMAAVSVVVTLSTRSHIMQTAVEEALSLGAPLITNRSEIIEEVLGDAALFVDLTAPSLIAALDATLADEDGYRRRMLARREARRANLRSTLANLRAELFA
ncbi:glycosyltransferase [Methylobacterium sp. ID0610]|uniref:glycosyltransferase n=1 Tax=Methylobacterium carpenticola TaxID=3344827 RepID=UPI0036A92025